MKLSRIFSFKKLTPYKNGSSKSFSSWRSFEDQKMMVKEEQKAKPTHDEALIIKEVRQLCHHSRTACAKVLQLLGELEKSSTRPPNTSFQAYGTPRQPSNFSKQVARFSTKSEELRQLVFTMKKRFSRMMELANVIKQIKFKKKNLAVMQSKQKKTEQE